MVVGTLSLVQKGQTLLCTVYCIQWFDLLVPFCPKDNVPTTVYHYSTPSTAYSIHWFDIFVSKTMSPPPYTTIVLCPLRTASTPSSHLCVILTQPDILSCQVMFSEASVSHSVHGGGSASGGVCIQCGMGLPPRGMCIQGSLHPGGWAVYIK